jgi:ABC-2 type transport system permease protein
MATELFVAMILMLLIGRQLISQDLRFNALPLYFSRPLRRSDYFIGKLGVIGGFLGMVIIVPSLIAYVLGMACSLDVTILRDTFPLLLAVIVYGLVITVSAGTLILALSSLSRNSRIVGLLWVGLWFVSNITASMLNTAFMFEQSRSGNRPSFLEARTSPANWSTLVSYTANLSRVGEKLLGADASWRKLADLQPESVRDNFLMRVLGPQYPWVWSAEVLVVLLLISACILHFRVRSLDRLK